MSWKTMTLTFVLRREKAEQFQLRASVVVPEPTKRATGLKKR
jgi:hypothetical protein